jgi:HlyD family secretion protein
MRVSVGTDVKTVFARPPAAPVDTLLQLVPARAWWALGGLGVVIAGALFWSVFGSVATVVDCRGIISRPGGLYNAVAQEGGPVGTVLVKLGDTVYKGQTLAKIEQPLLNVETRATRAELSCLRAENADIVKMCREDDLRYQAALTKQQSTLENSIAARERRRQDIRKELEATRPALKEQRKQLEALVAALEERVKAERTLLERLIQASRSNAVSARDLETARRDFTDLEDRLNVARADVARHGVTAVTTETTARREEDQAEAAIQGYAVQLATLAREDVERSTRQKERLYANLSKVYAAEDRLRLLESRQQLTQVVSNWDGRVVEVKADPGQVVRTGATVVVIEVANQSLVMYAFVPAWGGKKVKQGMKVEVTPAMVQREEFGYMVGTVRLVSPFPLSEEGLLLLIPDRRTVDLLTSQGSTFALEVEIESDPATPSGYRWSTGRGPNLAMESGTFCQARVITREQPPITLVLPALRRLFGVE